MEHVQTKSVDYSWRIGEKAPNWQGGREHWKNFRINI